MSFIILLISIFTNFSLAQHQPIEQLVPVEHVYVPTGYDSNDNIEVIVTGYLPNLCYKAPRARTSFNEGQVEITVTALYYPNDNTNCAQVWVPFFEVVPVGILNAGKYNIVANAGTMYAKGSVAMINAANSQSPDQFMYARVQSIEAIEGTRKVILKGYNPSDCFELKQIVTLTNGQDSYSILPIIGVKYDGFCPRKMVAFSYEYDVPNTINLRKILLHVRSMDGRSVNSIYDNQINSTDKIYWP